MVQFLAGSGRDSRPRNVTRHLHADTGHNVHRPESRYSARCICEGTRRVCGICPIYSSGPNPMIFLQLFVVGRHWIYGWPAAWCLCLPPLGNSW